MSITGPNRLSLRPRGAYAFNIDALSSAHAVYGEGGVQEEFPDQILIGSLVVYRLGDYWLVEEFGKGTV